MPEIAEVVLTSQYLTTKLKNRYITGIHVTAGKYTHQTLEGKDLGRLSGSAKGKPKIEVYDKDKKKGSGGLITPAKVRLFLC